MPGYRVGAAAREAAGRLVYSPAPMRWLRRLAVALVGLLALLLVGSLVLEPVLEGRLATRARHKLEAARIESVQIHGFPIALRLVAARIPRLTIDAARSFSHQEILIDRLRLDLRDVRIPWSKWRRGVDEIRVGRATWLADVSEDALNAYLAKHRIDLRAVLEDGAISVRGRRRYSGADHEIEALGRVRLERSYLVFAPSRITADGTPTRDRSAEKAVAFAVPFPPLPGGITVDAIAVHRDGVELRAERRDWVHVL